MEKIESITVTVHGWEKHNGKKKKGHTHFMLSSRFFDDEKIQSLTPKCRMLYLFILTLCADNIHSSVTLNTRHVHRCVSLRTHLLLSYAKQLEQYQLLTIDKITPLKNRKEYTLIEKNGTIAEAIRIPKKNPAKKKPAALAPLASPNGNAGQILIAEYCKYWKLRYGMSPPIRPQDAKNLKALGQSNGVENIKLLIRAYLNMPDGWFVKKRHDLQTFLNSLTAIAHFSKTGRLVTSKELNTLDSNLTNQNTLNALERGEV